MRTFSTLKLLVNPRCRNISLGSTILARLYNYAHQSAGTRFGVVYSMDGYDEISLTSIQGRHAREGAGLHPEQIGFGRCRPEELSGGDTRGRRASSSVLDNTATAAWRDCVLANAAFAIG